MTRTATAFVVLAAAALAVVPPTASGLLFLSAATRNVHDVRTTTAVFRAWVVPPLFGATVVFQYGTTAGYGSVTQSVNTTGAGGQEIRIPVTGLEPETTYHVRVYARSGLSWATGSDTTFTTTAVGAPPLPNPPVEIPDGTDQAGVDPATPGPVPASGAAEPPSAAVPADLSVTGDPVTEAEPGPAPQPTLGRTIAAAAVQGTVTAVSPTGARIDLTGGAVLPSGSVIDARRGTVALTSAVDRSGTTQTGQFWGARFEVRQSATGDGTTELRLRGGDFSSCRRRAATAGARARAAAAKPPRTLWGSDHRGRFQTSGRGSVATVRGTRWLTEDRCDGTLTRVFEGAVAVRDLRRHTTTIVTRGHRYLARVGR